MYRYLMLGLLLALCAGDCRAVATDTVTGMTVPNEEAGDYKRLTRYLCDGLGSEEQKVCAIYNWITRHIAYDVRSMQRGDLKHETAERTFRRRKGVCEGYARLLEAMCREAGIPAVKIDGYARDWNFDDGDKLYIPRHCWNAVLVNNKWQLIDVTWGAGGIGQKPSWLRQLIRSKTGNKAAYSGKLRFNFHYDPQYCMQPADSFRITHLPADPMWQLGDPMPIGVFESGRAAIAAFNLEHRPAIIDNPYLKDLATLNEAQRVYESADRAYEFNSRFPMSKAAQSELHALDNMAVAAEDSDRNYSQLLYREAKDKYAQAQQLLKGQKKNIESEYQVLRRKNKAKHADADRYVHALRSDNKRLVAQCNGRIRGGGGKHRTIGTKFADIRKKQQDIGRRPRAAKPGPQRSADAPEVRALQAAVTARASRIAALTDSLTALRNSLEQLKAANKQRLQTLAGYLEVADSALVRETAERIRMHDGYDEEVRVWAAVIRRYKYELGDTLHQQYLRGYEAIQNNFEAQKKVHQERSDLQRRTLRELEQCSRWTADAAVTQQYNSAGAASREGYGAFQAMLQQYAGYVQGQQELFRELIKVYGRQDRLTAYMEKAERHRREAEEKHLSRMEAFDRKENTQQQGMIRRHTDRADAEYARLMSGQKKRAVRKA